MPQRGVVRCSPSNHTPPLQFFFQIRVHTGSPHRGPEKLAQKHSLERTDRSCEYLRTKPPFHFPSNYYHDCGIPKYLDVSIPLLGHNGCYVNLHSAHCSVKKFFSCLMCEPCLSSTIMISLEECSIYLSTTHLRTGTSPSSHSNPQ